MIKKYLLVSKHNSITKEVKVLKIDGDVATIVTQTVYKGQWTEVSLDRVTKYSNNCRHWAFRTYGELAEDNRISPLTLCEKSNNGVTCTYPYCEEIVRYLVSKSRPFITSKNSADKDTVIVAFDMEETEMLFAADYQHYLLSL